MNDMAPVTPSAVQRKTSAAYGLLGLPLAFVALPVYVHLPNLYAQQYGVTLAALGAVLLLSRSIDAVVDPWLGRFGDRLYRHSWQAVWVAALLLATVVVIAATLDETQSLGMGSAYHHAQVRVKQMNALDTAKLGLHSIEHWYGIPEAMFVEQTIQNFPADYSYNNEQMRFAAAGRLWAQAAAPDSPQWRKLVQDLVATGITLVPTFAVYEANRDVMRARTLELHEAYSAGYMLKAFEPNPKVHGSYCNPPIHRNNCL